MAWLSGRDVPIIQRASRAPVVEALKRLIARGPTADLIETTAKFREPQTAQEAKKAANAKQSWAKEEVADYIAMSSMLHLQDGWQYLARASAAHLQGDPDSARHAAYYAELRAAMSLLASHGVGVFDHHHIVLDLKGDMEFIEGGTHTIVWILLENWSELAESGIVGAGLQPFGASFEEWLNAFGVKQKRGEHYQAWLTQWGVDIKRMRGDRDQRNGASYRPRHERPRAAYDAEQCTEWLLHLWGPLEPTPNEPFQELDRHLLRDALQLSFDEYLGNGGLAPAKWKEALESHLKVTLQNVTVSCSDPPGEIIDFLTDPSKAARIPLMQNANGTANRTSRHHHHQAMCRATLLLRLAASASRANTSEASLEISDIEPHLDKWGVQLGLWDSASGIASRERAWELGGLAATDLASWVIAQPADERSMVNLHGQLEYELLSATRFEAMHIPSLWLP